MVVVTVMMTSLGRRHNACKDSECNNSEHQIANLHGESSSSRITPSNPAFALAYLPKHKTSLIVFLKHYPSLA